MSVLKIKIMKPIKYRVFEHKSKKMLQVQSMIFRKNNPIASYSYLDDLESRYMPLIEHDTNPLHQFSEPLEFTGFTDKNEVDIYESDIVLVEPLGYSESEAKKYGEHYSVKKYNSIVEWEMHPIGVTFSPDNKGFKELRLKPFNHSYQSLEVIGNIFQNPELLK